MTDNIIFRFPEMNSASQLIKGYAEEYKTASTTFVNQMTEAIQPWEGASQEKFKTFIIEHVQKYLGETIPKVVEGLAQMLEANAKQMQDADVEIAKSLPASL